MLKKFKTIFKNIVITAVCITTVTSAIISSIPMAKADSSSILGTNAALGSPILNNNFTVDNWNKWEMICWGVFLSNFCQPLIDNYETAFKTGAGGSDGAGFQALAFGTGNDATNNETIEAFCDYAINQQKSVAKKEIFVGYTKIVDGVLEKTPNPNEKGSGANLRPATFNDFFFKCRLKESEVVPDVTNYFFVETTILNNQSSQLQGAAPDLVLPYQSIAKVHTGYIPTFYITNSSNKYIKILDYTNSWDVQIASAILNAVKHDTDSRGAFLKAYETLSSSNPPIGLDVFGNITVDNKMVLPASANQNITKDKQINLLNSWVMNGYTSTYSTDKLILGLQQSTQTGILNSKLPNVGGFPAFGQSSIGNIGLLYYDTDTVALMDFTKSNAITYGEVLEKLFNLDIASNNNKYPLKFEVAGTGDIDATWYGEPKYSDIEATTLAASLLSNCNAIGSQPEILNEVILVDGSKVQLFSDKPVIVANQLAIPKENSEPTKEGAIRNYYNFLYKAYTGDTTDGTSGTFNKSSVTGLLSSVSTPIDLSNKTKGDAWSKFQAYSNVYKNTKYPSVWNGASKSIQHESSRLCLVYPISDTMKTVSSVLGLQDGTEFSAYSSMIYMTYLDWYGIFNKTTIASGTESTGNFNTDIYNVSSDILKVDPSTITDFKSQDDLEQEVLQMGYLMLHPEEGRSYRKNLIYSGISDFMYEEYNRMVYGGASSTYEGSASKSNSGFLAVETYEDNWLTSWFLDNYVDIAVTLIAICCIAIVIIGLIKSKNTSWYIFSLFTVINVILLVPSSGDIVPYITSNFIQIIFKDNMTYWSMSENISNEALEEETAAKTSDINGDEDAKAILKLVNQLEIVYTDRALLMKQDTSQKLTQKLGGIYTDIQNIQSARWILPMVMQQFTGDNKSDDYVYVKLGNIWDDGTIFHWYYNKTGAEAATKKTNVSQQFSASGAKQASSREVYSWRTNYYADAVKVDNWSTDKNTQINYANYSYTLNGNADKLTHLASYILPDATMQVKKRKDVFGANGENYKNVDSWQNYIDHCKKLFNAEKSPSDSWKTNKDTPSSSVIAYEKIASSYDRTDISTINPGLSYFKTTESPYYYFFNVVKDCFDDTKTLGSVIGQLQGQIELDSDKKEVRHNFMYATKSAGDEQVHGYETQDVEYTGYIRDCLDLQEFFTNTIPYMYEMTIISGGFDGESGVLHDKKITDDSSIYKGNLMSWAYRCNWAVKLMENPSYSKPVKIKDKDGNVYTVNNPLLPECYPGYSKGRPMIFSEAQMKAYGLKQSDLNLVELKCIEVNKQVAKKWTLLINYAGTSGLTKEVLYRQMATDATTIFNQEFSSNGIINNKYTLYPQSIDLRYLSFDSVMKMLMLNVSKDSSYVYGDTMQKLLSDTDMVTAVLLLVSAWLCAGLIPLARMALMALIFYLGFIAIIKALFSSAKYKSQIACGQLVSNILFMLYTLVYYLFFGMLMSISSSDEVLSVNSVSATPGNPVWILIAIIVVSILYIVLMWQQICFCIKHFRDMGFEMYNMVAGAMVKKLTNAIGSLHDKITGNKDSGTSSSSSTHTTNKSSKKSSETNNKSTTNTTNNNSDGTSESVSTVKEDNSSNTEVDKNYKETNKDYTDDVDELDVSILEDINAEIEAGSKLE